MSTGRHARPQSRLHLVDPPTQLLARAIAFVVEATGLHVTHEDCVYAADFLRRHALPVDTERRCHAHHRGEGSERTGCNCYDIAPYLHTRMDLMCPEPRTLLLPLTVDISDT